MSSANSEALSRQFAGASVGVLACFTLIVLLFMILWVVIYWKLFSKAGYSGWLSLLMFVPVVNFGMILFLAFSDWPVLQVLRALQGPGAPRTYQPPVPQPFGPPAPPMRGDAGTGYAPPVPTAEPAPVYEPVAAPVAPAPMPVAPTAAPAPMPAPEPAAAPAAMPEPAAPAAPEPPAPMPVAPAWEPPVVAPAVPAEDAAPPAPPASPAQ